MVAMMSICRSCNRRSIGCEFSQKKISGRQGRLSSRSQIAIEMSTRVLARHVGQIEQYPVKYRFNNQVLISLGAVMAQVCEICGKGPQFGNNISHAHNVTK